MAGLHCRCPSACQWNGHDARCETVLVGATRSVFLLHVLEPRVVRRWDVAPGCGSALGDAWSPPRSIDVQALAVCGSRPVFAAACRGPVVLVFALDGRDAGAALWRLHPACVATSMQFVSDAHVLMHTFDKQLQLWAVPSQHMVRCIAQSVQLSATSNTSMATIATDPSMRFVAGSKDGIIHVWRIDDGRIVFRDTRKTSSGRLLLDDARVRRFFALRALENRVCAAELRCAAGRKRAGRDMSASPQIPTVRCL